MANWNSSVQASGGLTVYNNTIGRWSGIFRTGLTDINQLLRRNGVRIEFRETSDEASANIVVATANGDVTYQAGGRSHPITVDGSGLVGFTCKPISGGVIQKAFIFLPENPMIHTPSAYRLTGLKIMRAIVVHEYIHSIGLSNSEHTAIDVFSGYPNNLAGRSADDDCLGVMRHGRNVWFPPFILDGQTIAKIRNVWS